MFAVCSLGIAFVVDVCVAASCVSDIATGTAGIVLLVGFAGGNDFDFFVVLMFLLLILLIFALLKNSFLEIVCC